MWPFRRRPQNNYAFIVQTQAACYEHFVAIGQPPEVADDNALRVALTMCHVMRIHYNDYRDAIEEALKHV
jgi:hypothetical protein